MTKFATAETQWLLSLLKQNLRLPKELVAIRTETEELQAVTDVMSD